MEENQRHLEIGRAHMQRLAAIKRRDQLNDTLHPVRDKLRSWKGNDAWTPIGYVSSLRFTLEDCDCIKEWILNEKTIAELSARISQLEGE
jgi:hypothetical protein